MELNPPFKGSEWMSNIGQYKQGLGCIITDQYKETNYNFKTVINSIKEQKVTLSKELSI